jgi:hypothetical protein
MPDSLAAAERDAKVAARVRQIRFPWQWMKLERDGAFHDLGPASTIAIIEFIQKRNRIHWPVEFAVKIMLLVPLYMLLLSLHRHPNPGILIAFALFGTGGLATRIAATQQRRAARILAATNSRLALPSLIDALKYSERRTRRLLQNTLIRLLQNSTLTEFKTLQKEVREALYFSIYFGPKEYALALIEIALQFQDVSALGSITRLAATRSTSLSRDRTVQNAATQCVKQLHEIVDNTKRKEKLLRPVAAPMSANLLHPVDNRDTPSTYTTLWIPTKVK